jgi:hypothetical protein
MAGPRIDSISRGGGFFRRASPDRFLRITDSDRHRLSHGQEIYTRKTRVLGSVETKTKGHPRANSVTVISIRIGIIAVIRETPVIRPIVPVPMIALVVSPVMVHPVAGRGRDAQNSQADGEHGKANTKFVHNKAPAFSFAENSCSSER